MPQAQDTLVLVNRPIRKLTSGYDLRVFNLCRQMPGRLHLVIIPFEPYESLGQDEDRGSIFTSVLEMTLDEWGAPSLFRHFRTRETDYLRLAYPATYRRLLARIREMVQRNNITQLIVFGADLAGVARDVDIRPTLMDVCDSTVLRMKRDLSVGSGSIRAAFKLWRWKRTESILTQWFDIVTTIGPADTEQLGTLARADCRARIYSIPNGVGDSFLRAARPNMRRRGIAFWGNLPFPPNRDAVRYFFREVYSPFLRELSIEVCVVGRSPEPWLTELAAQDANVRVFGFVEDLAQVVGEYPVMVNPMLSGGGMKNKILEAFALEMAVVSTSLGADAFPEAESGQQLLIADSPIDFAEAIKSLLDSGEMRSRVAKQGRSLLDKNYLWSGIGSRWNNLLSHRERH